MYYIEKDLQFIEGVKYVNYGFHTVSQLWFDYINTELSAHIGSWEDIESFKRGDPGKVSVFQYDFTENDYNVDPNLFALRLLVQQEGSIFYKSEIKKIYNFSKGV